MNNTAERVYVDPDGNRFCDPWVLFENWLDKEGMQEEMDTDPIETVNRYYQFCLAEEQTGKLFEVVP